MDHLIEKNLRPGRSKTDQFIIATALSVLVAMLGVTLFPVGKLAIGLFEKILAGDHDAAVFLRDYFDFISLWIALFLVVVIFKGNRPMLNAVKFCRPREREQSAGAVDKLNRPAGATTAKKNPAGNNVWGLLAGLAMGFGSNGFCVLMSVLLGDIHIEYSGFEIIPFLVFFVCVFIQSAAEELLDRWYLYQKLRRRYKAPWLAIIINAIVFSAMHLMNPGISVLAVAQIFIIGVIFSLFVYYYNGLWVAMAFHAGWNFTQSILFGLPNSGIVSAYSVFRLDAASATNGLFYNVNFGVEGSLGAVVVLAAVGVAVYMINRGKPEHTDVWAETEQQADATD